MRHVHIWIVEDNNADVFLIELALGKTGWSFEKTIIGDGEKAVRLVRECGAGTLKAPDILVLDMRLPKVEGKDVLEAVRATPAFTNTGVAIFSSLEMEPGNDGNKIRFVQKPVELEEFLKVVTRTVRSLLPPEDWACTAV